MKLFKLGIVMLFHPAVAFQYMQKDRTSSFRYTPVCILALATIAVRIFQIYFTHYPLATVDVKKANLLMECAVIFVPLLSWVIASYAITTILDGEVLFHESMMAMGYALIPYIIINVPLTIATHLMDTSSGALYTNISMFSIIWVIALLLISLKVMNHYSIKKTIGIILLTLFTMVMLWATIALFAALTMRFVSFVGEVMTEIRYKMLY